MKYEANKEERSQSHRYNRRFIILLFILPVILFLTIILAMALGPVTINPFTVWEIALSHVPFFGNFIPVDWTNAHENIIWEIRFPRVLLGAIVGSGLSLAGTGIKALVKNSLAEPYILDLSSGASVGASLVILLGAFQMFGQYALSFSAFIG